MTRRLLGFLLFVGGMCAFVFLHHPIPTPPLFEGSLGATVRFPPVVSNDRAYLISENSLICLNHQGQPLFRAEVGEPRSEPVFPDSGQLVLVTDKEVRSFSSADGKPGWTVTHGLEPKMKISSRHGKILIHDSRAVKVFDGTSKLLGEWQPIGSLSLVIFGSDDILVGIFQTQTASDSLKNRLSGYSLSKDAEIWAFGEPVSSDPIWVDHGQIFCCTASGQPVVVDTETGKELFRVRRDGFRLLANTPSSLILLASGATSVETQPLSSGGAAWSVNSSTPIRLGMIVCGDIVLLSKQNARVFSLSDGQHRRMFEPGSVLRDGGLLGSTAAWITYEDSLWWNSLFCSALSASTSKFLWTAGETKEGVWPPLVMSTGDLLVSRNGRVRLFARSNP